MGQRMCPSCGAGVTGHRSRVYCSNTCQNRERERRRRLRNGEAMFTVRPTCCLGCNEQFTALKAQGHPRLYCSNGCRPDAYGELTPAERKRRSRRAWQQKTGNVVVDRFINCPTCGDSFTTSQPRAIYCSRVCLRRSKASRARYAKRSGHRSAEPPFSTIDIADRDGWRCGICEKRIPPAAQWPDPRSLSLDHVVPVSDGGDHVRANVQATHLHCNISKGTRAVGEQLRLIG